MYYTQEQIDRANQADLVLFLQSQGEPLERAGQEYRWKRHDSLTVRGNKWYRHSQSKGGGPVDFVMEFFGKSFTEAVELLTGEKGAAPPPDRPSSAPLSDFRLPPRSPDNRTARNYLTAARRIDEDVTGFFFASGDIYEDAAHHNAVFVGRDEDGIPRYAHSKGTAGNFRLDVKGSDKAFNFCYRGEGERLFVFEAPVDLLSFLCLFKKDWQKQSYLSLGGVGEKALLRFLSDRPNIKTVYLCLDSDEAGNDACSRLVKLMPEGYTVHRLNQNLLTLDFWQDTVTYAGHTLPTGSIGCAAMNIPNEQIGQLIQLSAPLAMVIALINDGIPTTKHFAVAKTGVLQITQIMRTLYPFSLFEFPADGHDIHQIFSEVYIENAIAYIQAAQEIGASAAMDEQYKKGVGVIKLISVLAQLGSTLLIFKQSMIEFAHKLHDSKRTPDGYAATFAEYFADSPENPTWMQLTNATVQYASAIMPKKSLPQLVKRMHYVSFVGMFRSDLFEGLCVGHAPRLCPICGKWFLTTDARQTKYCGGLAPGDKLGRTCRQIGNLKGREQRELADDHPIKAIYIRRMNTITQYLHRGTLDEQTAAVMKELAKDKLELAIEDVAYANGSYEKEMEQTALLNEARARVK